MTVILCVTCWQELSLLSPKILCVSLSHDHLNQLKSHSCVLWNLKVVHIVEM